MSLVTNTRPGVVKSNSRLYSILGWSKMNVGMLTLSKHDFHFPSQGTAIVKMLEIEAAARQSVAVLENTSVELHALIHSLFDLSLISAL